MVSLTEKNKQNVLTETTKLLDLRSEYLCDFGLSKSEDVLSDKYKQSSVKHTKDVGNVEYMAPEGQTTEYNHLIDMFKTEKSYGKTDWRLRPECEVYVDECMNLAQLKDMQQTIISYNILPDSGAKLQLQLKKCYSWRHYSRPYIPTCDWPVWWTKISLKL
ncbi:unnamed protein product [Medioppia subpectinata]|uniref:Uncharacterized protein n=1 Tax=Medioppia subpectinata TaxID=1979941 RepID=A0A7R9KZ08_9ACAR|nr:unnamed protein product [Medioppia subpectinata]CAG2112508.1 unnamed protein product [Medioppia subpectinata]